MIDPRHLRDYVIIPVLQYCNLYSDAAVALLLGTAAIESNCGQYLRQFNRGPGRGIYQIEPETHDSLWKDYLVFRSDDLITKIRSLICPAFTELDQLEWNLGYSTALARVRYLPARPPLPAATDLAGQAQYWKDYYQRGGARGRPAADYVRCYDDFVLAPQQRVRVV
jgi:hypothetical protein